MPADQSALDGLSMRGHLERMRDAIMMLSASCKSFKVSRRGEQRRAARAKNRRRKAAEARGSSAGLSGGQRAKDSQGQCANHKRAKSEGAVCVCGVKSQLITDDVFSDPISASYVILMRV